MYNLLYNFIPTFALLFSKTVELNMKIWFFTYTMVMYFFIIFHIFCVWFYTTRNLTYIQTRQWKYIQIFKKRFLQEAGRSALFLKLFFIIEKFFHFQDHPLTGSDQISNEHENMQNIWFLGHMDSIHSLIKELIL